jgi:hypothetical protein
LSPLFIFSLAPASFFQLLFELFYTAGVTVFLFRFLLLSLVLAEVLTVEFVVALSAAGLLAFLAQPGFSFLLFPAPLFLSHLPLSLFFLPSSFLLLDLSALFFPETLGLLLPSSFFF